MRVKKNRRTLKKRIRRALSHSAFITVLFINIIIVFIALNVSKEFSRYQAEMVSSAIQKDINSGGAIKVLGISNIERMNGHSLKTAEWVNGFDKTDIINEIIPLDKNFKRLYIKIELKGEILYSNEDVSLVEFEEFYEDTVVIKPIFDSHGLKIGNVEVRVNPHILFAVLGILFAFLTIISIPALIISKILSTFLSMPIINPINQLEKKFKAIAEGDHETAVSTRLEVKKPLREIESLIDSTNGIMLKLHGYNELLESQKEALESQNAELEVQNEELVCSKQHIEQQQAQLIQSEKMASVGMLTAAITHEINTPIGAINSNVQLEDMLLGALVTHPTVQEDEELSTMFAQLKETNDINLIACSRIIEIIKSLKSFSRLDQADFQEADINEAIKSVLVLTNNLLKRRITVNTNFGAIPNVKCYPGQLNQVFMNIIVNASQAIEKEGEIFISTIQKDEDIYIKIADTGCGIKKEDITKIFEPGFTTKGVGIGLGLGLYLCYNIINNHHGDISVISELGHGTEFTIRVPIENSRTL